MIIFYSVPILFIIILIAVVLGAGVGVAAWISQHYIIIGITLIVLKLLMLFVCVYEGNKSNDKKERFSGSDTFWAFLCEIITSLIFMTALARFAPIITESFGGLIGGCVAIILNTAANLFGLSFTVNKWGLASIGISTAAYLLCVFW